MAHRWRHSPIACNACAHLPAAGVIVGDRAVRVAAYNRVAAAVCALEHPVGVGAKGLEVAFRDNFDGHGEDEARQGEAIRDGCEDGLIGSWVSESRLGGNGYSLASAFWRSWNIF